MCWWHKHIQNGRDKNVFWKIFWLSEGSCCKEWVCLSLSPVHNYNNLSHPILILGSNQLTHDLLHHLVDDEGEAPHSPCPCDRWQQGSGGMPRDVLPLCQGISLAWHKVSNVSCHQVQVSCHLLQVDTNHLLSGLGVVKSLLLGLPPGQDISPLSH